MSERDLIERLRADRYENNPRFDSDDPDDPPECPVCSGPSIVLGALGTVEHYRCRDCGTDHSALLPDAPR